MTPAEREALPPHARNIHGEVLPEGYRFTPKDEQRLGLQDFYSNANAILPPSRESEADRFMAWRWYGQFYSPMREDLLNSMAWRIGRERQLLAKMSLISTLELTLSNATRVGVVQIERITKLEDSLRKTVKALDELYPKEPNECTYEEEFVAVHSVLVEARIALLAPPPEPIPEEKK